MNDFNLTSIDEVIKTVKQYGTSSWVWENGEISKDALVCNIFPILEDAKQFEIELSEDEFRDIEEDYDTADNTYNYGCKISNELDWREKKGVGCIVKVHLAGDVRGNYTDYFAVESMDDIFGLDSTFQPKEITDRYIADLNAFSEYYEVYDTVTQDNIGTCYESDREDAIKWIKENTEDETVTEELKLRESSIGRYVGTRLQNWTVGLNVYGAEDSDEYDYEQEFTGSYNDCLAKLEEFSKIIRKNRIDGYLWMESDSGEYYEGDYDTIIDELGEPLDESLKLKEGWRGCSNIEVVSHGRWSDPDLVYDGYTFNYWDIENALWDMFLEETGYTDNMSDDPQVEVEFDEYCQNEADAYLDDVIAGGYFADGSKSWHDSLGESCGKKKLKEAVADENTQIWASDAEYDYVESLDRDTLLDEFNFVFSELPDDEDINEYSDDELKEKVHDYLYDLDSDHEDLVESVIPEIEKQCYGNMIWVVGNYQRWDGGHSAVGYYDDVEKGIEDICYPNYDARTVLYEDENGNVCFTEYSHDTPMGGTAMTLYSFKDRDAFDKADSDDEEGAVYYDSEDPETVHGWIEKGYLTPIKWN